MQVFADPDLWVPAIAGYFPEKSIAFHHSGETFFVVLQMDKIAIPELVRKIGQALGQDMGVHVYFVHWETGYWFAGFGLGAWGRIVEEMFK